MGDLGQPRGVIKSGTRILGCEYNEPRSGGILAAVTHRAQRPLLIAVVPPRAVTARPGASRYVDGGKNAAAPWLAYARISTFNHTHSRGLPAKRLAISEADDISSVRPLIRP